MADGEAKLAHLSKELQTRIQEDGFVVFQTGDDADESMVIYLVDDYDGHIARRVLLKDATQKLFNAVEDALGNMP